MFKILHPEIFQGNLNKKNYFEGWYFKNVSHDLKNIISFIPGISLSQDSHAFIQVIDGIKEKTYNFRYPISDFKFNQSDFDISIGNSIFNKDFCQLNLADKQITIKGKLEFKNHTFLPHNFYSPGIMGWYSYIPFMQAKHGVVSLNHKIRGSLNINQEDISFDDGKGYIEKDWGTSFPEDYLWLQCNNFNDPTISLMLSVAKIPWLGKSFIGFLGFLKIGKEIHRYATYNRAKILTLKKIDDEKIKIKIKTKEFTIEIIAQGGSFKELKSPIKGRMSGMIKESVTTSINLKVSKNDNIILEEKGYPAGFELHNNILSYFN